MSEGRAQDTELFHMLLNRFCSRWRHRAAIFPLQIQPPQLGLKSPPVYQSPKPRRGQWKFPVIPASLLAKVVGDGCLVDLPTRPCEIEGGDPPDV